MPYHIIHIGSPRVKLTCKHNQLICESDDGQKALPIEDISSVVITSFSASIHSEVFLKAAEYGIAFIYCRNFKPVSLVLPANRSTDTMLTRAIVSSDDSLKKRLWCRVLNAKCSNQLALASHISGTQNADLAGLSNSEKINGIRKESVCARYFWKIFGNEIGIADFKRNRDESGVNSLLNFGYAILLSLTLRNLFAVGLDPTFGIGHVSRERATPLAYDLMEPFRPIVDAHIFKWVVENKGQNPLSVNPEFKAHIIKFPLHQIPYSGKQITTKSCIEMSIRSFRKAILEQKSKLYKPWTLRNTKWVGY